MKDDPDGYLVWQQEEYEKKLYGETTVDLGGGMIVPLSELLEDDE